MRTGDHLNEQDYVEFYNDKIRATNRKHGWAFVVVLILIVLGGILIAGSQDAESASVTDFIKQEAIVKKQSVMGHPCTYVAQCYRFERECDVRQRDCVNADLTRKK